jgi:hypothetical protein
MPAGHFHRQDDTCLIAVIKFLRAELRLSFQITILKVLAGHPGGRTSLAELRQAVAILMSSGADWTDRMKRLAARAPDLDVFGSRFVLRDDAGWQISDAGRAFLVSLEAPTIPTESEQAPAVVVTLAPPVRMIGVNNRRPRRGRLGDRKRRSA